jgi:hypothetical protein
MIEKSGDMIGVLNLRKIRLMALEALCRSSFEGQVDVALIAWDRQMFSNKRVPCLIVVDCWRHGDDGLPGIRGVAVIAEGTEPDKLVVWLRCFLIIRLVATPAIRRQLCVLSVRMAFLTLHVRMFAGKRELRFCMIEFCGFPCIEGVTRKTVMIELTRRVVGSRYECEILLMAGPTVGCHRAVSGCVTFIAVKLGMFSLQRKFRRCVGKSRWFPLHRIVARRALMAEIVGGMVG